MNIVARNSHNTNALGRSLKFQLPRQTSARKRKNKVFRRTILSAYCIIWRLFGVQSLPDV